MPNRSVRSILHRRRAGPDLLAAGPDETARAAARLMAEHCCGSVLVVEDGRRLGIFTERDLLERVVAAGLDPDHARLREVMPTDPETIGADETVEEAIRRMDESGFRHMPVLEGESVLGVISTRDIPALELGRMAEELDRRHRLSERI